jgi:hypothetical protein
MEYIVSVQSKIIVDAETVEEAADQVNGALEDVGERNCGGIDDEILASATITKIRRERIRQ